MQAKVSKWLAGVAGSSNISDNWHDIIHSCLSDFKINRSFKRNAWQCAHIAHYLKRTAFVRRFTRDKQSILFVKCESAIKELCRAILEAKLFLQDCSTADFWQTTNSVSNLHTGEAYDVLLHDLIWSTAALCLAIRQITGIGDFQEIINQIESCTWDLSCCRQTGLHLDRADFYRSLQNRPRLYYDRSRKKHLTFLAQKSKAWEAGGAMVQHLDVFEIDPGDLGHRKFLGAGGHGDVYRSSCFGQTVAVKVFSRASEEAFKNEASLLAGLQNPFIINMVGWCKKNYECMLVMELAQTDLGKVIKQITSGQQPALSWVAAVDIMLQISKGMEYLHNRKIVHRDIKPNNVLLEPSSVKEFAAQGHARVKLCDFGLAKVKQLSAEDRSRYTSLNLGTSYYRAPEVLEDDEADIQSKYTRKADVFSFAITCSEILAGSFTTCYQKLTRKVMREEMLENVRPNLPTHCPSHLRNLISSCWDTDPGCRPPFCRISNTLTYIKLILMRVSDGVMCDSVVTPFDEDELKRRILEDEESESGGSRSGTSREMAAGDNLFVTIPFDDNLERKSTYNYEQVQNLDIQAQGVLRHVKFELYDEGLSNYAYEDILSHAGYLDTAHVIGEGRFATVYRSHLPDGRDIALKILTYSTSFPATFDKEIAMLASIQHNHILPIKGYYSNPAEKVLVYEYFPRGTLYDLLHGEDARLGYSPDWATRQMIAVGVAQALDYLHHRSVLHMDVKSTNILLETGLSGQLLPKLADFGIKCLVSSTCSDDVVWREGYTAPEVLMSKKSTEKSDVYSFGVVLLELITGKKPIRWEEGKTLVLASWVEEVHRQKRQREIMDAVALKTTPFPEYLDRALKLALLCVNENPNVRPSMSEVAQVLEAFAPC